MSSLYYPGTRRASREDPKRQDCNFTLVNRSNTLAEVDRLGLFTSSPSRSGPQTFPLCVHLLFSPLVPSLVYGLTTGPRVCLCLYVSSGSRKRMFVFVSVLVLSLVQTPFVGLSGPEFDVSVHTIRVWCTCVYGSSHL